LRVEKARRNESLDFARVRDAVRNRGFRPDTVAMDKGHDNNRVYEECRSRAVAPIVRFAGAATS